MKNLQSHHGTFTPTAWVLGLPMTLPKPSPTSWKNSQNLPNNDNYDNQIKSI